MMVTMISTNLLFPYFIAWFELLCEDIDYFSIVFFQSLVKVSEDFVHLLFVILIGIHDFTEGFKLIKQVINSISIHFLKSS
jgi:hypothetical protein